MRLKWPKSQKTNKAQFPKFSVFIGQKSILRCYYIRNVKDGIQIQVYSINNKSVNHFSQFISVKVKNNLTKSHAQFQEKLRKLSLRQIDGFLIKKTCISFRKHPMLVFDVSKSSLLAEQFKMEYDQLQEIIFKSPPRKTTM